MSTQNPGRIYGELVRHVLHELPRVAADAEPRSQDLADAVERVRSQLLRLDIDDPKDMADAMLSEIACPPTPDLERLEQWKHIKTA